MVSLTKTKARICPKCGSLDVETDYTRGLHFIGGILAHYICKDCKFSSVLFPEVDEDQIENFRKKIKNANNNPKQKSS